MAEIVQEGLKRKAKSHDQEIKEVQPKIDQLMAEQDSWPRPPGVESGLEKGDGHGRPSEAQHCQVA